MSTQAQPDELAVVTAGGMARGSVRWRERASRGIALVLGAVLLAAAGLKLHALADAPWTIVWWSPLLIGWEWLLGACLMLGLFRRTSGYAAVATFTIFVLAALQEAWRGAESCGCFGTVAVPPWYTVALDSAAVAALAWRVVWTQRHTQRPLSRRAIRVAIVLAGGLALVVVFAVFQRRAASKPTTRPSATNDIVQAQPVAAGPSLEYLADVGYIAPSGKRLVALPLRHSSARPWTIGPPDIKCVCVRPLSIPQTVTANSSAEALFEFQAPPAPTVYQVNVVLPTGDPKTPSVTLRICARVGLPLRGQWARSASSADGDADPPHLIVRLHNDGPTTVRALYGTSSSPILQLSVPNDASIAARGSLELIVKRKQDMNSAATVSVHTDCPTQPAVDIAIPALGPKW